MHWSKIELSKLKQEGFNFAARFQLGGGCRNPKSEPIGFMKLQDLWKLPHVLEIKGFYNISSEIIIGELYGETPEQIIYIYIPANKEISICGWFCDLNNAF